MRYKYKRMSKIAIFLKVLKDFHQTSIPYLENNEQTTKYTWEKSDENITYFKIKNKWIIK